MTPPASGSERGVRERFVTPGALPTPHERELLTIFIEECAEAQQRATKMLRFGRDEVQPGQGATNRERLGAEVGDLCEMIERLVSASLLLPDDIEKGIEAKRQKLAIFMQTDPDKAATPPHTATPG